MANIQPCPEFLSAAGGITPPWGPLKPGYILRRWWVFSFFSNITLAIYSLISRFHLFKMIYHWSRTKRAVRFQFSAKYSKPYIFKGFSADFENTSETLSRKCGIRSVKTIWKPRFSEAFHHLVDVVVAANFSPYFTKLLYRTVTA